eukprot:395914_1
MSFINSVWISILFITLCLAGGINNETRRLPLHSPNALGPHAFPIARQRQSPERHNGSTMPLPHYYFDHQHLPSQNNTQYVSIADSGNTLWIKVTLIVIFLMLLFVSIYVFCYDPLPNKNNKIDDSNEMTNDLNRPNNLSDLQLSIDTTTRQ